MGIVDRTDEEKKSSNRSHEGFQLLNREERHMFEDEDDFEEEEVEIFDKSVEQFGLKMHLPRFTGTLPRPRRKILRMPSSRFGERSLRNGNCESFSTHKKIVKLQQIFHQNSRVLIRRCRECC